MGLFVYPALYLCGSAPPGSVGSGPYEWACLGFQSLVWWAGESHSSQHITIWRPLNESLWENRRQQKCERTVTPFIFLERWNRYFRIIKTKLFWLWHVIKAELHRNYRPCLIFTRANNSQPGYWLIQSMQLVLIECRFALCLLTASPSWSLIIRQWIKIITIVYRCYFR